jgi:hypothetical protein
VDTDLVHAAGFEADAQERVAREELDELEVRDRLTRAVAVEGLARRVPAVAADRRLDPARARPRLAPDEREVLAFQVAATDELLQPAVCLLRARDDEQARGVAVEPVDDAGPVLLPALGAVLDQTVNERALSASGPGMDDDACGLVDDEQVLVLVRDAEIDARGPDPLSPLGRLELDLLAFLEAIALWPRRAVDGDAAGLEQALGVRAGSELLEAAEEPVEPRARGVSADANADDRRSARRRRGARRPRR